MGSVGPDRLERRFEDNWYRAVASCTTIYTLHTRHHIILVSGAGQPLTAVGDAPYPSIRILKVLDIRTGKL